MARFHAPARPCCACARTERGTATDGGGQQPDQAPAEPARARHAASRSRARPMRRAIRAPLAARRRAHGAAALPAQPPHGAGGGARPRVVRVHGLEREGGGRRRRARRARRRGGRVHVHSVAKQAVAGLAERGRARSERRLEPRLAARRLRDLGRAAPSRFARAVAGAQGDAPASTGMSAQAACALKGNSAGPRDASTAPPTAFRFTRLPQGARRHWPPAADCQARGSTPGSLGALV